MILVAGDAIKDGMRGEILEAKIFTVMMDETRDLSYNRQVIIVIHHVDKRSAQVKERLLGVAIADDTRAEALESLLLESLEEHSLDIKNAVGQCYDGESHFPGVCEAVQARNLEKRGGAVFTHCFSHSLNRELMNAMNHPSIPEAKNCFSVLELLVVFIKNGHRIKFCLEKQSELIEEQRKTDERKGKEKQEPKDNIGACW